jgi:hypothetical protein
MTSRRAFAPAVSLVSLVSLVALACGSNEAERPGPQAPASNPGTGPLAGLESSPFMNEVWSTEDGQQAQFLYYPRENVRISGTCRLATGQLQCEAIRFMRNGMPVEIARRALDGRTSAGVKVCQRMNQPIITVRNSVGAEDSFCRFADGSLISTGALEQYAMRVIQ